jgi:LysM repeat protein
MHKSGGWFLPGMIVLGTIVASACTQTYSQAPVSTPTLIPTGLFVSPFPAGQDPLKVVAELGTQTAAAKTAQAGGTVMPTAAIGTNGTPVGSAATPAPVTVEPGATSEAPLPTAEAGSGGRPSSYTVQAGEFPYCLARRFNVNPDDLLSANGLTGNSSIDPGMTLTIPQTGSFPGDRAWHAHPDTYTVDSAGATLGSVACYYGDLSPQAIASANGLSISSTLSVGQQLTIP